MPDQNLTALLSALIGGALTIIGGFTANYYTQNSQEKKDKRKEIHDILESIYRKSLEIENTYSLIATEIHYQEDENSATKVREILEKYSISSTITAMTEINMLVDLYVPPLKAAISTYVDYIGDADELLRNIASAKDKEQVLTDFIDKLREGTNKLREAIVEILCKKGYIYF